MFHGLIVGKVKSKIEDAVKQLFQEYVKDGDISISADVDPHDPTNLQISVKYTKKLG